MTLTVLFALVIVLCDVLLVALFYRFYGENRHGRRRPVRPRSAASPRPGPPPQVEWNERGQFYLERASRQTPPSPEALSAERRAYRRIASSFAGAPAARFTVSRLSR